MEDATTYFMIRKILSDNLQPSQIKRILKETDPNLDDEIANR